jgi:hypothetical protein
VSTRLVNVVDFTLEFVCNEVSIMMVTLLTEIITKSRQYNNKYCQ